MTMGQIMLHFLPRLTALKAKNQGAKEVTSLSSSYKNLFFYKKNWPIPAYFLFVSRRFNMSQFKLIKAQIVCLGFEPGQQDGRRRRIH